MEWLTVWLKKIILLVLLAAFLDLILPNTSLQRYVKMVMGLIILLTILSPVFALFQLSQEEMALRLDRYQEQLNKPVEEEWQRIVSRLRSQRDQQVEAYVQRQLETAIGTHVKERFGVALLSLDVKIDNGNPDKPSIDRIELIVADEPDTEEVFIPPVKPVVIEVGERSRDPSGRADIPAAARPELQLHRQIAESVAREWSLAPEQVIVTDDSRRAVKQ